MAETNQAAVSWGATVDAASGPAPPAAVSSALCAILESYSRVRREQTVAAAMAEADAAAAAAGVVDYRLVTSTHESDAPETEEVTPEWVADFRAG